MSKNKKAKKKIQSSIDKNQFNMKVVTSDVCARCLKCERGRQYLQNMSLPGAVGKGVPCMLTRGKAYG
ncbi:MULTISPECIES: hypothetical protein [unclassified Paenibacillus]|uniref:hypothetical protein n=1 Tax=unclassified Paenibacillus TaxID=185978 RepID=UPI001AE823E7|nr:MULTISPECIES: hypothetical protein [unclassified Paenibacillus]MBP1154530.1 hypothetical protein [Paenibacillus sp. PvP091]MBP1170086.1 hypothetical protein [Paenibacillus sp. PvR098]MBP2441114.1 hypothetical protein [Paenibacillus sp. PvP052]